METVSTRRNRVYPRKFDHEQAQQLHAQGWTKRELAELFQVSQAAVARVTNPDTYRKMREASVNWLKNGTCVDCGRPCSRNSSGTTRHRNGRCRDCHNKWTRTTVRATELRCYGCHHWQPDNQYAHNKAEPQRRGRHGVCTDCNTVQRRHYRDQRMTPCAGCGQPTHTDGKTPPYTCPNCWRNHRKLHSQSDQQAS